MTDKTIVDALDRMVTTHPQNAFLIVGGKVLTYGQVGDMIARAVTVLERAGVGPGDRVMVLLPNEPAFVAILFAAFKLGAIVVPAHPLYKRREIETVLSDCAARVVVARGAAANEVIAIGSEQVTLLAGGIDVYPEGVIDLDAALAAAPPAAPVVARVAPNTVALFLYTSGTTGAPKGAVMSHRAVHFGARSYALDFKLTAEDDARASDHSDRQGHEARDRSIGSRGACWMIQIALADCKLSNTLR
jgi:long-chain acyl-CoA synthetase